MSPPGMKVTLSYHQRSMLKLIADRGGETPYRFGVADVDVFGDTAEERDKARKLKEGADESIRKMATMEFGTVITITPIVNPLEGKRDLLTLTEVGRKVLGVMKEHNIQ